MKTKYYRLHPESSVIYHQKEDGKYEVISFFPHRFGIEIKKTLMYSEDERVEITEFSYNRIKKLVLKTILK